MHAFVWNAGEMTDLGTVARSVYQSSRADDVDDQGRIVGAAWVDNMNTVPVMCLIKDPAYSSGLDHAVHWLSSAFVDMKFYLLFSFLFGYSFQLQMEAASRAGAAFKPRMLRRLGGLP